MTDVILPDDGSDGWLLYHQEEADDGGDLSETWLARAASHPETSSVRVRANVHVPGRQDTLRGDAWPDGSMVLVHTNRAMFSVGLETGDADQVVMRRFGPTGLPVADERIAMEGRDGDVAVLDGQDIVVVASTDSGIFAAKFSASGDSLGPPQRLLVGTQPIVVAAPDGGYSLAYSADGMAFAQRFSEDGEALGPQMDMESWFPSDLAIFPDSTLVTFGDVVTADGQRGRIRRFAETGFPLGGVITPGSPPVGSDMLEGSLAVVGCAGAERCRLLITWVEAPRSADGYSAMQIFAELRSPDMTPVPGLGPGTGPTSVGCGDRAMGIFADGLEQGDQLLFGWTEMSESDPLFATGQAWSRTWKLTPSDD